MRLLWINTLVDDNFRYTAFEIMRHRMEKFEHKVYSSSQEKEDKENRTGEGAKPG